MSFQISFGTLGILETYAGRGVLNLFYVYFLFRLNTNPHLLQLFRRMLQHCFAVKIQKNSKSLHLAVLLEKLHY